MREWEAGDGSAVDRLMPVVYEDLQRIAHRRLLGEQPGHTLDTTALVHECYLSLVDQNGATPRDRRHFFALAAKAMRHILVDYARRRSAAKRGGDPTRVDLDASMAEPEKPIHELLALDQALTRLSEKNPSLVDVVECRYFAGMTMSETADVLGLPLRSAERRWTRARTYLYRALSDDG